MTDTNLEYIAARRHPSFSINDKGEDETEPSSILPKHFMRGVFLGLAVASSFWGIFGARQAEKLSNQRTLINQGLNMSQELAGVAMRYRALALHEHDDAQACSLRNSL